MHNNLGAALHEQGRLQEALTCYEESIRLNPDYSEAHWNRALGWLVTGNFEQGWPEYEWRFKRKIFPPRPFPQPIWDGSSLAGKTILVHAEQGLGDTLQFVRYVPLVKQHGGTVIVECPQRLMPLLRSCPGIDQIVAAGASLPPFDVHLPLLTAPSVFKTTLATVPANVPYLFADAGLVQEWGRRLTVVDEFKIGISWQGDPKHRKDRFRSIRLAELEPLARLEGVRLFSLQKGPGMEQLSGVAFPITDLGSQLDESTGAFMDTAAVIKHLDLVIAVDSAVAHSPEHWAPQSGCCCTWFRTFAGCCTGRIAPGTRLCVSSVSNSWACGMTCSADLLPKCGSCGQQARAPITSFLAMTAQVAYNSLLPADGA